MNRSILHLKKSKIKILFIIILLLLLTPLAFFAAFNAKYQGRVFPNVYIANMNMGGLTPDGVQQVLAGKIINPYSLPINGPQQTVTLSPQDIDLKYDFSKTANGAFKVGRSGDIFQDFYTRSLLFVYPIHVDLSLSFDENKLQKFISVLSGQVSQDPIYPTTKIVSGKVVVNKGAAGTELDGDLLDKRIVGSFQYLLFDPIDMPIKSVDPSLTDQEADDLKQTAEKYVGKKLQITFEFQVFTLNDSDIVSLLGPKGGFDDGKIATKSGSIASQVNRDPANPKFSFDSGKVSEFQPATDAVKVDEEKFGKSLVDKLTELGNSSDKSVSMDIPVVRTPPDVSTGSVNNLGIKELIGRGTSTYFHSIPSRVHNVVLAASRINGTLVKPGDTFSFNDALGDVSQFTGYQQAYIISGGKTILGDGGGVCQVSTTLFRALLNAGLPINERTAHAYRVGYYEQNSPPGLDATVYGPTPDLKFTNDTPGYILIEAIANPKSYSLVFELYGTSDGRVATITKPVVSDVVPALPTVYQDDPTLPTGTTKQIDFSAAGARVTFNYFVSRGGINIYKKTFISNYRPWAAVYLRGTGPAI